MCNVDSGRNYFVLILVPTFIVFAILRPAVRFQVININGEVNNKQKDQIIVTEYSENASSSQYPCGIIAMHTKVGPDVPRLGNQMFSYASLFGIAHVNKKQPIVWETNMKSPLYDIFHVSAQRHNFKGKESGFASTGDFKGCCHYNPTSAYLNCYKNYRLHGWTQSWKYFEAVKEKILNEEFVFRGDVLKNCSKTLDWIVSNFSKPHCLLIGAHMRRGDFARPEKVQYGHWPAQPVYVQKAIDYYRKKFANVSCLTFVVYSDSYKWAKAWAPKTDDVIVMKPRTAAEDMCVLSKMNHSIYATGTFGFWSAYLAGGHVTYQKEFARKGSPFFSEFKVEDAFRPEWVAL